MTRQIQASIIALVCGAVLLLGGLFGIYYQGPFWASGFVEFMNAEEDAFALGLPCGVTLAGALVLSYVILASRLTESWSHRRRSGVFAVFSVAVLGACAIAAWLAGQVAGARLQKTEAPPSNPGFLAATESGITTGLMSSYNYHSSNLTGPANPDSMTGQAEASKGL
jgi:hypothetical protein